MNRHTYTGPVFTFAMLAILTAFLNGCSAGLNRKSQISQDSYIAANGNGNATTTASPTCRLTMTTPHQGGSMGRLIFEPLTNPNNASTATIWDASNPQSERKTIDSLTPRQIMVNPPGPLANFRVKYDNDPKEFTCELQVTVNATTGGVGGTGMIIIMINIYTPPPPSPIAFFPLKVSPSCSNSRRPWPKRVAYDTYPGKYEQTKAGANPDRLKILLSLEVGGQVVFGRFFPKIESFFNGGYSQLIPADVLPPNDVYDITVRTCVKDVPSDRPLVESDFTCTGVILDRQLGLGKKVGTSNTYLTENVATFKRSELLSGAKYVEFWNHRGNDDNNTCISQYSPLVMDILGNGIKTSSATSNSVYFDLTHSGREVHSGWVAGKDDALLVRDLDGSGVIESGAELFGEYTGSRGGEKTYDNGFLALKALDSNNDNLFSPLDAKWNEVKLWFASDFERLSTSGSPQLQSLNRFVVNGKVYSIDYINLSYGTLDPEIHENGNTTKVVSEFVLFDGGLRRLRNIADIWFGVQN